MNSSVVRMTKRSRSTSPSPYFPSISGPPNLPCSLFTRRFEEIVEDKPAKKAHSEKPASAKRPAEAAPAADGGAHKKHKKNKGGDKPASAPAAAPAQAKSEGKPANGAQQGEHKKNKKNKVRILFSCS